MNPSLTAQGQLKGFLTFVVGGWLGKGGGFISIFRLVLHCDLGHDEVPLVLFIPQLKGGRMKLQEMQRKALCC